MLASLMTDRAVPRRQGRYFVVAPGTVFPKICIRTGRKDDLIELKEEAGRSMAVERTAAWLGSLFAYDTGLVRCYIHRDELARIKSLCRRCSQGIVAGLVVLAAGLIFGQSSVIAVGVMLTVVFTSIYKMLPTPVSIAAFRDGQIFLLKVPPEIVETVLREK